MQLMNFSSICGFNNQNDPSDDVPVLRTWNDRLGGQDIVGARNEEIVETSDEVVVGTFEGTLVGPGRETVNGAAEEMTVVAG